MRISDWSSDVCSSDLCYPDIESLPKAPDLAVLAIGAKDVTPMLERCHAKGVKAAIVYAAGFAEEGPIGRALQDQLEAFAEKSGMVVAGPNLMGQANLNTQAHTAFASVFNTAPRSEEHTSELQSLMRISYAVFCLKKK